MPYGRRPKNFVTNRFGQTHDVPNLYVCDASVFLNCTDKTTTISILAFQPPLPHQTLTMFGFSTVPVEAVPMTAETPWRMAWSRAATGCSALGWPVSGLVIAIAVAGMEASVTEMPSRASRQQRL